jgi:hypothetical protein
VHRRPIGNAGDMDNIPQSTTSRHAVSARTLDPDNDDRTLLERLYRCAGVEGQARPPLTIARNATAVVIGVAVVTQLLIWTVLCISSGSLWFPWWIWFLAGGGIVTSILTVLSRRAENRPGSNKPVRERAPSERPTDPGSRKRRSGWGWVFHLSVKLFVVSTAAEIVVWLIQGLDGGLDTPWWTWASLPLAGLVLVLRTLARHEGSQHHE